MAAGTSGAPALLRIGADLTGISANDALVADPEALGGCEMLF
jgi:hypothetical protein